MGYQGLIAKARAQIETPETVDVQVVVGDEIVQLKLTKILGADWIELTRIHPPRVGATLDGNLGYNVDGVSGEYPADKILVNGETGTAEDWAELYGLFDAPFRSSVATALWGLNHYGPTQKAAELGKALKAGSRRKRN